MTIGTTSFLVSDPCCASSTHADPSDCAYRVAWSINPHMRIGSADTTTALGQHASFLRALRQCGAGVEPLPFVHGAFDSVFAKDSAILADLDHRGPRALLASPRHAVRRAEQVARRRDLERAGFAVEPALDTCLEGGDVVLFGDVALLGYGFRSSPASAVGLGRFLGRRVIPLELRDPSLYHLDTALTALSDGTLVIAEGAFSREALQALTALPLRELCVVGRRDALRFGLNVVEVGDTILTGTASSQLDEVWASVGRKVLYSPLDEFHRAGGSAACLAARVHTAEVEARAAA